jgi:hypothetical protein
LSAPEHSTLDSSELELAHTEQQLHAMMDEEHRSRPLAKLARQPRRKIPASFWLLALLIPYSAAATWAWIYLLQSRLNQRPVTHVLETISDQGLYEDFLDGRRREVVPPLSSANDKSSSDKVISPLELLPTDVPPITLGTTRRIGALAITPVEVMRTRLHYDYKGGRTDFDGDEAIVLKLQVKNEGSLIFRPDDETFNRAYLDDSRVPVYTYLQIGQDRFYGAVANPTTERLNLPHCPALLPDETGFMYVTADRGSNGKASVLTALRDHPGQLIWRVQIRRGKEDLAMSNGRNRQVWVTAVVPIQFQASEIKSTERIP